MATPSENGAVTIARAWTCCHPHVAVFTVQRDNRFGHPHPMVVECYRALGTQILRIDEVEAITFRIDGQSVRVELYGGTPEVLSRSATHRARPGY